MRKCRAASNRSAVRVARDAGGPHPAVHMFGRLKSHSFCFLLSICAQGPAGISRGFLCLANWIAVA